MRASELIAILEDVVKNEGDIPLRVADDRDKASAPIMGMWVRTETSPKRRHRRIVVFSTGKMTT